MKRVPTKKLQHSAKKPRKRFQLETDYWEEKNKKTKKHSLWHYNIYTQVKCCLKKVWKEIGADYIVTATETESEGGLIFVAALSSHDSNGMDLK